MDLADYKLISDFKTSVESFKTSFDSLKGFIEDSMKYDVNDFAHYDDVVKVVCTGNSYYYNLDTLNLEVGDSASVILFVYYSGGDIADFDLNLNASSNRYVLTCSKQLDRNYIGNNCVGKILNMGEISTFSSYVAVKIVVTRIPVL